MIKQLILLDCKEGMSFEEFEEYWLEEHAPLVEEMPYVDAYSVDLPADPDRSPYDGAATMYFEDRAAMAEAWESEAGQEVQADAANFADVESQEVLVVEEHVQFDHR